MSDGSAGWRPVSRPGPLRETVRETLEDMIVHGVLGVGERLREETMAERLQVSRQPIREALQHLAQDGFVDLRQGRGAYVHVPTRQEIDDVFQVRTVLEAQAARLAAQRMTEPTLRELNEMYERGAAAAGGVDTRVLVDLNHSFHALIIRSAGNTVLTDVLAGLQKRIDWYFAVVAVKRAPASWEQHERILKALTDRDEQRAAELMTDHVSQTGAAFAERFGPEA
ncbi:GntR family transcriptional regulator [Plantactinospora sp. CA-290183]|uniref:GntR family transcriptional regulator n=1 Tax=Plantactinospora sp. CA-290183 TaxID=3240006 RepID=UPI003D8A46AC